MLYYIWSHWEMIAFWSLMIFFILLTFYALWDDSRWTENCPYCGAVRKTPRLMRRHIKVAHHPASHRRFK